jgi:putative peptide zinc metalloprotease protein
VTPDVAELLRRSRQQKRRTWMQKYLSPLSIRIPLVDPERFLERRLRWYRWMFGPWGAALWLAVVGTGGVLAAMHWKELSQDMTDQLLLPGNLVLLALVFPVVKLLHELGHACATKAWGGEVHDMGVMLLVLMPVPYVDASASTAFREVSRRAVVGAAGMLVELFVASIALFLWLQAEPGVFRAILYNVMVIAGISTVIFNGNPLLRFDGYYILSDLLQIPNLRQRGQKYLTHLVETRAFGVRSSGFDAAQEERAWLAAFTVASFVYRILVMVGIALFIATQYFIVGILLALFVVATSLVWPVLKGINFVLTHPKLGRRRGRAVTVTAAASALVAALLFLVPLPLWTLAQGVTWAPPDATVFAGSDGFVRQVSAESGSPVRRGATLLVTEDPLLELRTRVLEAQVRLLSLRAHAELQLDRVRWELTREELVAAEAELALAKERGGELVIRAPADGVFLLPSPEDLPDRFLRKGQQVGYVVRPDTITVKALVPQEDADLVLAHTERAEVRRSGAVFETLHAVMKRQVPQATNRLPNPALSTQGGGLVPVDPRDPQAPTALQGWFEIELELPATSTYAVGERVYVRFEHGWEPVAFRLYRSVRQLFMKRFVV